MSTELTAPATGATWKFNLSRHDEDPAGDGNGADDAPEADDTDDDAEAEGLLADAVADGDDEDDSVDDAGKPERLGEAGKKALDRMKAERNAAKKAALDAKRQAADLARKVQEFEDRDKSDLDKANAKAERLATQAAKATQRAVSAEVRSLAVGQFADAGDAVDVLMRDASKYVDSDGEIDTDLIEADLADLLERKPHWAKPEPAPAASPQPQRPKAKPDPSQGSRGPVAPVDFRTASRDEVDAELAKFRFRQRL